MGVTRVGHSRFSSRSPSAVACPRGWGGELSATGCAWLGSLLPGVLLLPRAPPYGSGTPGQQPQSGAWTLQLEAVRLPAVYWRQSRGGVLSIHPESSGWPERLPVRGTGRVQLQACSPFLTLMLG